MFSAAAVLIEGNILASLLLFLASISLLLTDPNFNTLLARRLGKDKIPTLPNITHYVATFSLFGISGNYISPQTETYVAQDSIGTLSSENSNGQIRTPSCVSYFIGNANLLWSDLNDFRYEADFYKYGYSTGKYAEWESNRSYLQSEWGGCEEMIDPSYKLRFRSIPLAISFMYPVGKTWYQNEGRNTIESEENVNTILKTLNYDWGNI